MGLNAAKNFLKIFQRSVKAREFVFFQAEGEVALHQGKVEVALHDAHQVEGFAAPFADELVAIVGEQGGGVIHSAEALEEYVVGVDAVAGYEIGYPAVDALDAEEMEQFPYVVGAADDGQEGLQEFLFVYAAFFVGHLSGKFFQEGVLQVESAAPVIVHGGLEEGDEQGFGVLRHEGAEAFPKQVAVDVAECFFAQDVASGAKGGVAQPLEIAPQTAPITILKVLRELPGYGGMKVMVSGHCGLRAGRCFRCVAYGGTCRPGGRL